MLFQCLETRLRRSPRFPACREHSSNSNWLVNVQQRSKQRPDSSVAFYRNELDQLQYWIPFLIQSGSKNLKPIHPSGSNRHQSIRRVKKLLNRTLCVLIKVPHGERISGIEILEKNDQTVFNVSSPQNLERADTFHTGAIQRCDPSGAAPNSNVNVWCIRHRSCSSLRRRFCEHCVPLFRCFSRHHPLSELQQHEVEPLPK